MLSYFNPVIIRFRNVWVCVCACAGDAVAQADSSGTEKRLAHVETGVLAHSSQADREPLTRGLGLMHMKESTMRAKEE